MAKKSKQSKQSSWWEDGYEYGDYDRNYSSKLDWLSDDNYVGMARLGTVSVKPKKKKAPAPQPKAEPVTPKVDTIQQTYQKQIADLTKRIETIQATPPKANVPPPKPPTTPYSVNTQPVSLSNPYKTKKIGGIGQFAKKTAGNMLASIKSNLINF